MADTDIMRGLVAIDDAIRASVLPAGEPGSGLYLLLDTLATNQLGAARSGFPPAPLDGGEGGETIATEAQPAAEPTAEERHRHGRHS